MPDFITSPRIKRILESLHETGEFPKKGVYKYKTKYLGAKRIPFTFYNSALSKYESYEDYFKVINGREYMKVKSYYNQTFCPFGKQPPHL